MKYPDTTLAEPLQIALVQAARHATAWSPQAPGERGERTPLPTGTLGHAIQKGIRRRIVPLTSVAQRGRNRREEHEVGQMHVLRQFIEVQRAIYLGAQHP